MKLNFKLLYFLTLGALCLYVVTGPAQASAAGPYIASAYAYFDHASGLSTGSSAGSFAFDAYNPRLDNVYVECEAAGGCSADIDFFIVGMNYPVVPLTFDVSLSGISTDPNAHGTVSIQDPPGTAYWGWSEVDPPRTYPISMSPLQFSLTPGAGGSWEVMGTFSIASLASGGIIEWGATSLDFGITEGSGVPEPSSALLFAAGLAVVEFLRRKSRR